MVENDNEILLTEDGHPIGQVVLADNTSQPDDRNARESEEAGRELLRSEAQALTGNPDADLAVAELFPGFGDDTKRERALGLYVRESKTIDEIATAVGVPSRTVSQWMFIGQWDKIVRREIMARQAESVLSLARLRADERVKITKEQLEQAKMIRDKAAGAIDRGDVSLKSGTEAWAAAAKVEQTLTGVSEAGTIADIDGKSGDADKGEKGKTPLVVIYQGGLPPIRKATSV